MGVLEALESPELQEVLGDLPTFARLEVLARLIYQDAPVMILDEPVTSLDPEGERAVFELFSRGTADKVIISTTHRYDSIPADTQIVVLADGRIVENGTHEELVQRQRDYWSLYTSGSQAANKLHGPGERVNDSVAFARRTGREASPRPKMRCNHTSQEHRPG